MDDVVNGVISVDEEPVKWTR